MSDGPYLTKVSGRDPWHIRDGKIRISTGETSRAAATAALVRYVEDKKMKAADKRGPVMLSDVIDLWVKQKRPALERSGGWQKKWRYIIEKIKPHASNKILEQIDRQWSRDYVTKRLKEGSGGPSIRQELSTVAAAWKLAKNEGLTALEPIKFELPAASPAHDKFMTKAEARALLDAAQPEPHLHLFLRIGFETGGRPGAILGLTWAQFKTVENRAMIDFRETSPGSGGDAKGAGGGVEAGSRKRRAMVPISTSLRDEMKAAQLRAVTDNVIERNGKPVAGVRKSFAAAVEAAGISKDTTPHIMRHSVITWLMQSGKDAWAVAGFVGHSSPQMILQRYGHHSPDHLRDLRSAIDLE